MLDFLNPSLCNQAGRSGSAAKLESLLPPGGRVHNLLAHVHTAFQSGTAAKVAAAWAALHVFGEVGVDLCRPSRQYPGICEQSPRYRDLPQAERQPHVMLVMTCPATRLHLLKFVASLLFFFVSGTMARSCFIWSCPLACKSTSWKKTNWCRGANEAGRHHSSVYSFHVLEIVPAENTKQY